jgi:hypothetical protein
LAFVKPELVLQGFKMLKKEIKGYVDKKEKLEEFFDFLKIII